MDLTKAHKLEAGKREWFREWLYWLSGALIMTVIWGVQSVRAGELEFFWPMAPLGIWAAVLVSYAIVPGRDD